jgi:hypothetical protein
MEIQSARVPKENVAECYSSLRELRAYKQKPVLGKCMFWADNCATPPIGSHLLSRSWLEQVADTSHEVIRFRITTEDRMNKPGRIEAYGAGINKELRFPCFCLQHDDELFACLEKQEFSATREQLRALTYRSVCCEACAKHQIVGCLKGKADLQMERALNTNQEAPPTLAFHVEIETIRCIQLFVKKDAMENNWRNRNDSLVSYVIRFATRPTVLVSTTVTPLVTFTGRILESRWDWISLSVIPGTNGGWAVFTWDKSAPKNPSLFVKSFAKVAKELQTVALLNFIFESSENFAIAPQWWESLTPERHNDLFQRFGCSIERRFNKPASNTLLLPKTPWVDWNPVEAGYV